jgi:LysR family hca operon transcriptional activator
VELRHLKYFVAVAEELNFTRAAARLRTAQPSLSQQIRQLEKDVDVLLLDRSHRRVALTNAGRIFLQQARDILDRVEHARRLARRAAEGEAGELSVGTFPSADVRVLPALRPLVAALLPDLRLILHSKYAVDPLIGLLSGTLDVALMRGPVGHEGIEECELLTEPLVIVLPTHHPLARRERIPVRSLDDLPCITLERSASPPLHDAAVELYRQARIRIHAVCSADNVLSHLQMVQEGMGFALMPESISALLPPGVTYKALDLDPVPRLSIVAAWRRGNSSRLLREFVNLARRCTAPGETSQVLPA